MPTPTAAPTSRNRIYNGQPERMLSVREIAQLTGLHERTVQRAIMEGELAPARKLRRRWRVPESAYHAWLDDNTLVLEEPEPEPVRLLKSDTRLRRSFPTKPRSRAAARRLAAAA